MTLGLRGGMGLLLAATLCSAPALAQQVDDEESEAVLDGMSDAVQDVAQDVVERSLEKHSERVTPGVSTAAEDTAQGLEALHTNSPPRVLVRPVKAASGLGGAEGAAAFGDDVAHAVQVSAFADDAVRGVGTGAASVADDAARVAGGGCIKSFGGVFAVLGALLVKLFGGGKKDE
jgi:hypothetical protein